MGAGHMECMVPEPRESVAARCALSPHRECDSAPQPTEADIVRFRPILGLELLARSEATHMAKEPEDRRTDGDDGANHCDTKRCPKCARQLPYTAFAKDARTKTGLRSNCRECCSKYQKRYHREHQPTEEQKAIARARATAWRLEHPERHQANIEAYRRRKSEIRAAQIAVQTALVAGRLVRQPCEVCGSAKSEAHHDDYDRPLDVRWLCRPHHIEADRDRRRAAEVV
jgi:hypothetical protein